MHPESVDAGVRTAREASTVKFSLRGELVIMNAKMGLTGLVLGAFAATWLPQAFAADSNAADNSVLEEVVVTAEKRERETLDVPISVTVVDAAQLSSERVRTLRTLLAPPRWR